MSTRFAVAVHVLVCITEHRGRCVTSETIAGSAGTNPVVVRRLLLMLARAGLTVTYPGLRGGTVLARPAEAVTLLDVYRAVGESDPVALHRSEPDVSCPIGRHIRPVLAASIGSARAAFERELAAVTIADVHRSIEAARSEA